LAAAPSAAIRTDMNSGGIISINEVLLAYMNFATAYYSKDGEPTKELESMREALRALRQLYGHMPAADFGPKGLQALRQHLVEKGLCRNVVNHRVSRIKRMFKWAVAEQLVPPSVHHGLQARETEPVRPVPDQWIEALLPFLTPIVAGMVQVQRLTGMRPCEVVLMRACDLDRTGEVWVYEPTSHKNRWRGHRRLVPLGPRCQEVLRPFLSRSEDAYLFSPRESEAWRRNHRRPVARGQRRTPIYPSELRAREKAKLARRRRQRKRPPRDRFDTASYRRAITYAIRKARGAGVEVGHWHPGQLRHSRATEIRQSAGIEAAQVVLGHARADVTQVYAERNLELAKRIAKTTG
jgi:integrase